MRRRLFFNLWYLLRRPQWDTGISPPELIRFIQTHPSGRALDLGCGTGTNVITLAKAGWQATGVDFASSAISKARRKARQSGITADFRVGDVTRLHFPAQSFDLILDMGCFHGLEPDGRAVYAQNIQTWLAPGGTFLLYAVMSQPGHPIGITDDDLTLFSALTLTQRADGMNPGPGARPSVWVEWAK